MKTVAEIFITAWLAKCHFCPSVPMLCFASVCLAQLLSGQSFPPGALDSTFDSQLDGSAKEVLVQPDGHLLVAGGFHVGGLPLYTRLARFTADGSHDASFAATSNVPSTALALQADGRILVGSEWGLDRLHSDGSLDSTFHLSLPSPDPDRICCFSTTALAVQGDGGILVAGYRLYLGREEHSWIAPQVYRLQSDGALDESFMPHPATVRKLAILADHRILVMGTNVTRLHPNGHRDTNFVAGPFSPGPFGTPSIDCFAFQPDGRILIGGSFTNVQGHMRHRVVRLWPDGQLDLSFNPPPSTGHRHRVNAIALQSDGRILVAGTFDTMAGYPYAGLVRLNADGTLDPTLAPINGIQEDGEGAISVVTLQDETRALVGGSGLGLEGVFECDDLFRLHLGTSSPRLSIEQAAGGNIRLTYSHAGESDFIVVTTTNLSIPASNWSALGPATNVGAGLYDFLITPSGSQRYFQLRRIVSE